MAITRVKVWSAGEILYASDLNSEFNNVLNNGLSLISPLTASLNAGGFKLTNYGGTDVPSAASDVPTYAQLTGRTTVSVKDPAYGAVGDGITNDTVAIQSAIDSGKDLFFPAGTYLINGTLVKAQDHVSWHGCNATLKKNTTGVLLTIGLNGTPDRMDTFSFSGLIFKSDSNTGGQTIGVDIVNSTPASQQNITFVNCRFQGFANGSSALPATSAITRADYSKAWYKNFLYADFLAQSDTDQINPSSQSIGIRFGANIWSCRLQNCWIEGCNIGVASSGGTNDYLKLRDSTIIACGAAFVGDRTTNLSIEDCTIEFNYSGIWVWGAKHISVRGSQLEGNDLHHLFLGANTTLPRCQMLLMENVNLQPLSGSRLNQVNALYLPACDSAFIRNVSFNGSTTVQTTEKGYDIFCGTETYRIVLEAPYESSDGFIQINDTTKLAASWRKDAGNSRYQFYDKGFLNLPKQIGTVEGDLGYDTTNHWPTFYDGTSTATITKNLIKIEGATTDGLSTSGPTVFWTNPSGKKFFPIAYGIKVVTKTGTAGTGLVFDIERGDASAIVRLQTVTLSVNAGIDDMQFGSMTADLVHSIGSAQTWSFKITTAASGGTISVFTVKPFVVGYLE